MDEPRICANEECQELFIPKVHNAVYCSPECRTLITNKKVLDKYYADKERKKNKTKRICATASCNTLLSSYNDEDICGPCGVVRFKDRLEGWGWDRKALDEDWSY